MLTLQLLLVRNIIIMFLFIILLRESTLKKPPTTIMYQLRYRLQSIKFKSSLRRWQLYLYLKGSEAKFRFSIINMMILWMTQANRVLMIITMSILRITTKLSQGNMWTIKFMVKDLTSSSHSKEKTPMYGILPHLKTTTKRMLNRQINGQQRKS